MKLSLMTTLYRTAVSVMLALSVNTTAALAGATMPDTLKSGRDDSETERFGLKKKGHDQSLCRGTLPWNCPRRMHKRSWQPIRGRPFVP